MKLPLFLGTKIVKILQPCKEKAKKLLKINPDALMHRFYGAVDIDGIIYRVKTTMHEHYGKGNAPMIIV